MRTNIAIAALALICWTGLGAAEDTSTPAPSRLDRPASSTSVSLPAQRTAEPAACAALCRLFEFMGSLERRPPADSVPSS